MAGFLFSMQKRTPVKIYALYDSRTNYVFYVGFAKKPSIETHKTASFFLRTRVDQYVFSMMLDNAEMGLIPIATGFPEDVERWKKKFPKLLNSEPLMPGRVGTERAVRSRFTNLLGKDGVDKLLLQMGY